MPPIVDFNLFEAVPEKKAISMKAATAAVAAARRPVPRGATAGDYIKSAFVKLAEVEAAESFNIAVSATCTPARRPNVHRAKTLGRELTEIEKCDNIPEHFPDLRDVCSQEIKKLQKE